MDTSETIAGKHERAPVEGAIESDIPARSWGKTCRAGDLHLAFAADKEVAGAHAQWWHSETGGEVDTQARKDPGAPFVMDAGWSALSARVAEEPNRVLGQELTGGE